MIFNSIFDKMGLVKTLMLNSIFIASQQVDFPFKM